MRILFKKMSFVLSILIMLGINQVLFAETEQTDTLQVTIEGRDVTADWSLMPEAERYTLYYAYAEKKSTF